MLIVLGVVVTTLSSLAIRDLGPRFSVGRNVTPLVDWENEYSHFMRIRQFMPSRWMIYTSLVEQVFLNPETNLFNTDRSELSTVTSVKTAIAAVNMNGQMIQHLEARRYQGVIAVIIGSWWLSAAVHKRKNAEHAPPAGRGEAPRP